MLAKRVFLSSTSKDLIAYRNAVYKAIEGLDGYHCMRMEDFGARAEEPSDFCFSRVVECDIFVGIVGHIYGSCPTGSEISYSEGEYNAAISNNIPRLMFMAPKDFLLPAYLIEPEDLRNRQNNFRTRVNREAVRSTFTSPADLAQKVTIAIFNMKQMHPSIGCKASSKIALKAETSNTFPIMMIEFKDTITNKADKASRDNNCAARIEFGPELKPMDKSEGEKMCKQDEEHLKQYLQKLKKCWEISDVKK